MNVQIFVTQNNCNAKNFDPKNDVAKINPQKFLSKMNVRLFVTQTIVMQKILIQKNDVAKINPQKFLCNNFLSIYFCNGLFCGVYFCIFN